MVLKKLFLMYSAETNSKVPMSCTKFQCGRYLRRAFYFGVSAFSACQDADSSGLFI